MEADGWLHERFTSNEEKLVMFVCFGKSKTAVGSTV